MMSGDFLLIQHDGPIIMKLHCGHYLVLSFVVAYIAGPLELHVTGLNLHN